MGLQILVWLAVAECSLQSAKGAIVIGGVPLGSDDAFLTAWRPTFEQYLSNTVGRQYNPPVNFTLVALTLSTAFSSIEAGIVDFVFANPSLYSCLAERYSGI